MKNFIRGMLSRSGGAIKNEDSNSTFAVQKELITSREPVIFDIGAKAGVVTKRYRGLFPFASIYSFEPFPSSLRKT